MAAAALVGAFFALFAWQSGAFFRRNRPGRYRPDAVPADLVPDGRAHGPRNHVRTPAGARDGHESVAPDPSLHRRCAARVTRFTMSNSLQ